MTSNDDGFRDATTAGNAPTTKRRRVRSCDNCRRKKIGCDGTQESGTSCSNCTVYKTDCTYVEAAQKRKPAKPSIPKPSLQAETSNFTLPKSSNDRELPKTITAKPSAHEIATTTLRKIGDESHSTKVDTVGETSVLPLVENLKHMSVAETDYRFHGKSSSKMFIHAAIRKKMELDQNDGKGHKPEPRMTRRPEFWTTYPFERLSSKSVQTTAYQFPPQDLIRPLVGYYFEHHNKYLPLLHRPTFERNYESGMHLVHETFGATLLLVCALGAEYCDDPRVFLEGEESKYTAGWKWFNQVPLVKQTILMPPTLYDLQVYSLAVNFLKGAPSGTQACWTLIGIGIRLAQDVGAHRRKPTRQEHAHTVEDELWKRAFWVLMSQDSMLSSAMGRPCTMQEEDFDVERPIECDDEYWDHPDPEQRFKQPPGKPSKITAFNLWLNLQQILVCALRTIYSINKSKILLGFVGPHWEKHIVSELDSALNKWIDTVPDFLRWDPMGLDNQFFDQSVVLYCHYYQVQILVHRPFIPSADKPSPLSFPSLAICTNSARVCSHIVDVQRQRGLEHSSLLQVIVFTAGVVLLFHLWGSKSPNLSIDHGKEMADVHKCLRVLQAMERRWRTAGKLRDMLSHLASVGDASPRPSTPGFHNDRGQGSPERYRRDNPYPNTQLPNHEITRPVAGSRRVASRAKALSHALPAIPTDPQQYMGPMDPHKYTSDTFSTSLPVYSNELGRFSLREGEYYGDQDMYAHGEADVSSSSSTGTPPSWGVYQTSPEPTHASSSSSMGTPPSWGPFASQEPNHVVQVYAPPDYTDPRTEGYLIGNPPPQQVPAAYPETCQPNYQWSQPVSDVNTADNYAYAAQLPTSIPQDGTTTMWSNAPADFNLHNWGVYISSAPYRSYDTWSPPSSTSPQDLNVEPNLVYTNM